MSRRAPFVALLSVLVALSGCSRETDRSVERTDPRPAASLANGGATAASQRTASMPEPTTLLRTNGSAYAATLAQADEGTYLLTSAAAYRLVPGRAPERWGIALGFTPALMNEQIVYWSEGAFRRAHTGGGEPVAVGAVPHAPERLVASGNHFVWLDHADDGRFTLMTMDRSKPRALYTASGSVAALAMDGERVTFVERDAGNGWRLGAVQLSGGAPRYTAMKSSRTPAVLAVAREVFYYDGPSSEVRRVSPDLAREDVVARDVICSPIAVAEHVYCAQPAGLLEIGRDGVVRRALPLERQGTITAVSATENRISWLMDVGRDQLVVQSIPLDR